MHLRSPSLPSHTWTTLISLETSSSERYRQRYSEQWTQDPCGWIPFFCTSTHDLYMQVSLQQQYIKARPACQVAQPTSLENIHGLSLKLIINYVILDILPNTFPLLVPLLVPLLPPRARGCLTVVVAVPLLVYLIFYVIFSVPLLFAVPLLLLVVTVPFLVAGLVLYLFMGLYYYICLDAFTSVTSVGFILQ